MNIQNAIVPLTLLAALAIFSTSASSNGVGDSYKRLDQGSKWTSSDWKMFYSVDQGSLIIPYPWAVALREPNGQLDARGKLKVQTFTAAARELAGFIWVVGQEYPSPKAA